MSLFRGKTTAFRRHNPGVRPVARDELPKDTVQRMAMAMAGRSERSFHGYDRSSTDNDRWVTIVDRKGQEAW